MVTGIGIDIVNLSDVDRLWRRHGPRFEEDLLTPHERERLQEIPLLPQCDTDAAPQSRLCFLASRFAAKEATVKALGGPHRVAYNWSEVRVIGESRFTVEVRGQLKRLALASGCKRLTGALDNDGMLYVAVVMGETE